MSTSRARPVTSLALGVLLLAATGCQAATERLTESAAERALGAISGEDVDLDLAGGSFSIDGPDGSMSVGQTDEIPDAIVAAVPVPVGFEPVSSFAQRDGETQGTSVQGLLPAPDADGAMDALTASLAADGWDEEGRIAADDTLRSATFRKGERTLNVGLLGGGDEDLMLTLTLLEPADG